MQDSQNKDAEVLVEDDAQSSERIVYVVGSQSTQQNEVSFADLWDIVWDAKWTVTAITIFFATLAIAYAFLATEWYRAEVLLVPAEDSSASDIFGDLDGLGGLIGLAGGKVGGGNSVEAIAVMQSRDFTRAFIEDRDLLPVFFEDQWDSESGQWEADDPDQQPDVRDGVKYFAENVRTVIEDTQTGLVTLQIEWTDPVVAAEWAADLVSRLNSHMRMQALDEAERNYEYLQSQLAETNVATLRETIANALEMELQKLMLAKGNKEFAFRIVDSAQVPKFREWPKRILLVMIVTFAGGILAMLIVFIRHAIKPAIADKPAVGG